MVRHFYICIKLWQVQGAATYMQLIAALYIEYNHIKAIIKFD